MGGSTHPISEGTPEMEAKRVVVTTDKIKVELTVKVASPDFGWVDLYREESELAPGDTLSWTYPAKGLTVTIT
jgi:hypothetical protein